MALWLVTGMAVLFLIGLIMTVGKRKLISVDASKKKPSQNETCDRHVAFSRVDPQGYVWMCGVISQQVEDETGVILCIGECGAIGNARYYFGIDEPTHFFSRGLHTLSSETDLYILRKLVSGKECIQQRGIGCERRLSPNLLTEFFALSLWITHNREKLDSELCSYGWRMPAVLELKPKSYVGPVFIEFQWTNNRNVSRHPRSFSKFQLAIHSLPLGFGVSNVKPSQNHNGDRGQGIDSSVMPVKELEEVTNILPLEEGANISPSKPHCLKRPHYVLGIVSGFVGFSCLIFGGAFLLFSCDSFGIRRLAFLILGLTLFTFSFWLVYQAFCLTSLCVEPCVTGS